MLDSFLKDSIESYLQGRMTIFEEDEVKILLQIIKEYKMVNRIKELDASNEEASNRNIRIYTKQFNEFSSWCKDKGLTQADALYKAIDLLMGTGENEDVAILRKYNQEYLDYIVSLEEEVNEFRRWKMNLSNGGKKPIFDEIGENEIRECRKQGLSIRQLADKFNCSIGLIHKIVSKESV